MTDHESMVQAGSIPIPVEGGELIRPCVVAAGAGRWAVAWAFDGGRDKRPTGLSFSTSRLAITASLLIRTRIEAYA